MRRAPSYVLLVEDNADHAELVRRSLSAHDTSGHLLHVSDGETALDFLFRRGAFADPDSSPRPDVVLLDLRLPRVDGLEVLKAVKQDRDLKQIPVVVLTSSAADRDVAAAYRHHVNSYLVKPVGFREFDGLMKDLESYWLERNRNPARLVG